MRRILFFCVAYGLSSCNVNTPPDNHLPTRLDSIRIERDTVAQVKEFRGLYQKHLSHLVPCDSNITYVLKNTRKLDSLYQQILPNAYKGQAIYVEIRGVLDPNIPGTVVFTEALKAEQKNHKNICQKEGTVYWIRGTEPFWTLEMSEALDLIDFYDPMTQTSTHFPYVKPKIKAGVSYFDIDNGKDKISIRIRNEKCSGAIDTAYDLSASVRLNEKELHGCGTVYYALTSTSAHF